MSNQNDTTLQEAMMLHQEELKPCVTLRAFIVSIGLRAFAQPYSLYGIDAIVTFDM